MRLLDECSARRLRRIVSRVKGPENGTDEGQRSPDRVSRRDCEGEQVSLALPTRIDPATTRGLHTARVQSVSREPADQVTGGETLHDQVLLQRWKSGDNSGFHALMSKYERLVYRVIWKVVRHDEDARDLLQETFLRLWRNTEKLREDVELSPWLLRCATNLAIDHLRKHKPGRVVSMVVKSDDGDEVTMEPADKADDPRVAARRKEIEERVREAIEELPKRQRMAMHLRGLQDLSLKEIAKILACEERTVGTTLFAARKKLIQRLKPLLEELQELASGQSTLTES